MSTTAASPGPGSTALIRTLVGQARTRLRMQGALEGAATALIVATASALAVVFAVRTEVIDAGLGGSLLVACLGIVVLGAILGAARKLDDELVARRVDRASGLADRLSNAIAFERTLGSPGFADADRREVMEAAIRDAAAAAPRANVAAATPYRMPRDARAAAGFLAVSALVAGLAVPLPDRAAALIAAEPSFAAPGTIVVLRGRNLLAGVDGAATPSATAVPANVSVFLGETGGLPASILAWSKDEARIEIPKNAAYGDTAITAFIGTRKLGPVPFTVIDPKDQRYHSENSVAMSEDDLAYAKALLEDLRATAKADEVKELDEYVAKIEALLDQAERGEITKEKLLEELDKAQDELNKGQEPNQDEVNKDLAKTGEELKKDPLTKELGEALVKNDLQKAQEAMEKLAEKIEKGELTKPQQEQLAKTMEKAAQQFDKRQQDAEKKDAEQQSKTEEAIRQLEKQRDEAKTEEEKQKIGRQLEKKQDELKKLERQKKEKAESAQRESLKRLHRNMKKTAESLSQKRDPQDQQGQEKDRQEASRSMKDAAEETGKVDRDQRKTAAQKKVASQMEDLKEAMRRAKQRGAKGPKDPFGRNGKQSDFAKRASGQKGNSSGAWKPGGQGGKGGKGQGDGQGDGENGGDGQGKGPSSSWGTGHDPNLTGDATGKGGHTKDQDIQGVQGKGPSRRETILSAAQKGFASRGYQDVYVEYKKQVEDVMHGEKVPSSYKYYVKRYFTKIKPHSMD